LASTISAARDDKLFLYEKGVDYLILLIIILLITLVITIVPHVRLKCKIQNIIEKQTIIFTLFVFGLIVIGGLVFYGNYMELLKSQMMYCSAFISMIPLFAILPFVILLGRPLIPAMQILTQVEMNKRISLLN
jgi:hypothetical protein